MTVIYFTDGTLIDDIFIRRSLLRIPEVLTSLKASTKEFINCDLFLAMNEQSVYSQLNFHQKTHLKLILQNALFSRWLKKGTEPDLILKRSDYFMFSDLTDVIRKLSTVDEIQVVTIGPGFDDLESFLRLRLKMNSTPLSEFISQDPKLNWFWTDLKNQLEYHS